MRLFAVTLLLSVFTITGPAQPRREPMLAQTPPMGWNSWNHFGKTVTEADVRAAADALVSSGMRDAGYIYINIDDTWEGTRDSAGVLHPNSKFPDMKALGDYIHSKGLKFGIYSSPGPKTCAGYAGSYGHEDQDAWTYASWGVDFLKYDLCSYQQIMVQEAHGDPRVEDSLMKQAYERMHSALLKAGRPIVYSFCQYGRDDVWVWGPSAGANMWRTTLDIQDNYARMSELGFSQAGLARYASSGHWNDPDMLEIGNGGMNENEYKTQMSLWALLAAPLLAGNDLSSMGPATRSILLNREVIAVDQDARGIQGDRLSEVGPKEIWTRPLSHGAVAIGLFNRSEYPVAITVRFRDCGLGDKVQVRDLWSHIDLGELREAYTRMVPAHGVVLLRATQ